MVLAAEPWQGLVGAWVLAADARPVLAADARHVLAAVALRARAAAERHVLAAAASPALAADATLHADRKACDGVAHVASGSGQSSTPLSRNAGKP